MAATRRHPAQLQRQQRSDVSDRRDDGTPITPADARTRARLETLVEVTQHKGDTECRPGANDELCGYEKVPWKR